MELQSAELIKAIKTIEQLKESLKLSEKKLHSLDNQQKQISIRILDAMPFGILITREDQKIIMINEKGLSISGYNRSAEVKGNPRDMLIAQQESKDISGLGSDNLAIGKEYLLHHKSGNKIPVLLHTIPIPNNNERLNLEIFIDITEHRKEQEDLFEIKRRFSTLLDNLPGMVYRCRNDRHWTMEFLSDGCQELTGYPTDHLVMNKILSYNDLIVNDDRERIWDETQGKIYSNQTFTVEYRIITADKKTKWVWEKAKGIFDNHGKPLYVEGFISDITEQKHAELVQKVLFNISKNSYIAASIDDVFRSIHENLKQIIDVENFFIAIYNKKNDTLSLPYQVDAQDNFTEFPAGKTLTGYVVKTRKALLATENTIKELASAGQIEMVGTPAKVWLGVPLIVDDEVIGVIVVQSYRAHDQYTYQELELLKFIADQIAIVISRKEAEDSFQKEKAYLDQLFEGSSEAIIMIDLMGNVTKINSEFSRLFGYTPQEIIGKSIDQNITSPEFFNEASRITSGISTLEVTSTETKRRHRDGHLIDVSLLVTPIIINGKTVGGYGIYRDISDRKKIEINLIAAKEKAEESDKLKSAFLSNMSHEIRTPMNAILGFSTLLSDPGVSEEEKTEFVHIIRERGNDLLRIIDDIIDIAKIESGQIKIEIKECAINQLMTNLMVTLNEVKRKTAKSNIVLNCLPANTDRDFSILTDGNRLRQVMTNLIENALKFTHEGFVEFGYTLKNMEDASYIEFFVRDSGIGIPHEMHEIIFERFRQVDDTNTRKYGGTGLGLTISKNLIKLLGGEIKLASEKNKGTTFHILLPLEIPGTKITEPRKPLAPVTSANDWTKKVILVVEDEDSNFFLMDRILRKTGARLIWAKNGMDAIELCKTQPIDLILMDIRMPIMDGYEATQIIKKDKPNIPIIAQTAYALKGEREKSLAAGCDNYISKPIDSKELIAILHKYLVN
ncbi:MAG: PAS domain S-box protein [Bacteroidales bacterium]|nr:PAS domain S-box protein [Bacteroidales bacterium]